MKYKTLVSDFVFKHSHGYKLILTLGQIHRAGQHHRELYL